MGNHVNKSTKRRMSSASIILIAACAFVIIAIGATAIVSFANNRPAKGPSPDEYVLSDESNPVATIELKNGSFIIAELFPDIAPNTVANFISLANEGFYDGLTFHRVIPGFMIQGGDPDGNGSGGPGYSIKGEFALNGFKNDLKHTRGVLSMARANDPDSAGSQFFIMHAAAPHLDGSYAAFGNGIEAVDAIAQVRTDMYDKPVETQAIRSIRVDTKGVNYPLEKIGG